MQDYQIKAPILQQKAFRFPVLDGSEGGGYYQAYFVCSTSTHPVLGVSNEIARPWATPNTASPPLCVNFCSIILEFSLSRIAYHSGALSYPDPVSLSQLQQLI